VQRALAVTLLSNVVVKQGLAGCLPSSYDEHVMEATFPP